MSAPSEDMPIVVSMPRSKPLLLRHLPYFIGAAIAVALAATMQFDGYVHNILMQATTFAIAVFGLSVVLGLCGQINLAQAAFFGFGAYAVGIGTFTPGCTTRPMWSPARSSGRRRSGWAATISPW